MIIYNIYYNTKTSNSTLNYFFLLAFKWSIISSMQCNYYSNSIILTISCLLSCNYKWVKLKRYYLLNPTILSGTLMSSEMTGPPRLGPPKPKLGGPPPPGPPPWEEAAATLAATAAACAAACAAALPKPGGPPPPSPPPRLGPFFASGSLPSSNGRFWLFWPPPAGLILAAI